MFRLKTLTGQRTIPEPDPTPVAVDSIPHQPTPTSVCLLQATKIPARHTKIVAIGTNYNDESDDMDVLFFEPENRLQELTGLVLEEGVLSTGKVSAIAITNPSHHPICLEEGQLLGHMHPTQLVETMDNSTSVEDASVSHGTNVLPVDEERRQELLQLLQNDRRGLGKEE